ncbi:MAG: hypothetical protein JOZ55_03360 [Alphaproteobacteria bacterium]|nr:hypothetical protein [Alphaproteobacteria bacterium]
MISAYTCAFRVSALVAVAIAIAGCGFHPLYGTAAIGSGLNRTFASVYVEPIADYNVADTGYELRNALIDLLDSNQNARYRLKVSLTETTEGLALLTNASITRYNDTLTVRYSLVDSSTGKVATSGIETGLAAYNVVSSPYATLIAQQDADKRVAQDMAERIRISLGVFFEQNVPGAQ